MTKMTKKCLILLVTGCLIFGSVSLLRAGETRVGSHIKLTLFDGSVGKSDGISGNDYTGMGFREMILYVSQELTDKVSVDLQPMWSASSGATPKFGKEIGEQKTPAGGVEPEFHGWVKAVVKAVLPQGYEIAVGIVKPQFTWDYSAELFWEDEYNGSKFACNDYLGAMHDTGIEVYKSFELGEVSLPAYLYLLNGGNEFSDNNKGPAIMLHAEPEIGAFKFLASLATGKWDDNNKYNMTHWAVGAAYTWKDLSIRNEYAGGIWKNSIAGTRDAKPFGCYVKVFYKFTPWGRAMLHYNVVDHNFNGFFYTAPGGERYTTITPGLQLYASNSSVIQIQYDFADWKRKDGSNKLSFTRLTVGWRTTF